MRAFPDERHGGDTTYAMQMAVVDSRVRPMRGAGKLGPAQGRMALWPDNSQQVFSGTALYGFQHERLNAKFRSLLDAMRCKDEVIGRHSYLGGRLGISGVAHQNGTTRFGEDPTTSVLDVNCRLHDVDNVYVVDAGFFVSSSAVNPTLTIIANALRVADHLVNSAA
jgi:choline dehydrogenase-like flavoprotein